MSFKNTINRWRRGGPQPSDVDIGRLIRDVAETETPSPSTNTFEEQLKALADRVELQSFDFERWESYKAASAEYILEFATEIRWHRRIRLAVVIACAIIIVGLTWFVFYSVKNRAQLFGENDTSHALTALIVACIGGSVVITIAVARGAFNTLSERNAGLPMPEHMKEVVEAAKPMLNIGS